MWTQILISLIPALIIAIATAFLTVRLALRRFHSERWWERKVEAYTRIIEALHDLIEYSSANAEEELGNIKYTEEYSKQLWDNYRAASADLRKATGVGAYIISDEVAELLDLLDARPKLKWEENAPWDIYYEQFYAYKEALAQIRLLAKKDLRVS